MSWEINHNIDPESPPQEKPTLDDLHENLVFNETGKDLRQDADFSDEANITLEGFEALKDAMLATINAHLYTKEKE